MEAAGQWWRAAATARSASTSGIRCQSAGRHTGSCESRERECPGRPGRAAVDDHVRAAAAQPPAHERAGDDSTAVRAADGDGGDDEDRTVTVPGPDAEAPHRDRADPE